MSGRGIHISQRDDVVIARLEGDIDLANTPTLSATILEAIPNDALGLVVDLSGVRYIDSVGIRMLFGLVRALHSSRQGVSIALDDASPVRRLAKITNLDEAVVVCASVDECVDALRQGPRGLY